MKRFKSAGVMVLLSIIMTTAVDNIEAQTYEKVLKTDSTSWVSWHRELEYTMRHVIYVKQTNGINNLYISTSLGNYTDNYFVGTLREDDGRLWITYQDFPNNEYLLMDMNLDVGDEFAFDVYNNIVGTVSEIRYENGHKIIVFDRVSYNWYREPFMFIEGVGRNIIGFLSFNHDAFYQSCKFDGGELAYSTPNTHFRDCEIITDDTDEHLVDNQDIEVYPNPAKTEVVINIKNNEELFTIQIFNVNGTLVKPMTSNGEKAVIPINDLSAGVYIIKVIKQEHELYKEFLISK